MSRFIKKSSILAFPPCILFLILEYALLNVPTEYEAKIQNFQNKSSEIEVLILGSSHALRGINPHEFENGTAFNMAMVSQALQIDRDILFLHDAKMPKLKTVIISLSHFSLSGRLTDGEIRNRLPFYNFFYNMRFEELSPFDLKYYSLQASMGFRRSLYEIYNYFIGQPKKITCDEFGWMGSGGKDIPHKEEFIDDAKTAVERHEDGSRDFSKNINVIKSLITWSEKEQTQLLFINTPKTKWYNTFHDQQKSKLIDSIMVEMTSDLNYVQYLDFKTHPTFKIEDFRNSDHLNVKGAKKLTKMISSYIQ